MILPTKVVHDIFQVLGKGILTYENCVLSQMYFCTMKICLIRLKYYYKWFQKQNLCAKYKQTNCENLPEIKLKSSMAISLS